MEEITKIRARNGRIKKIAEKITENMIGRII